MSDATNTHPALQKFLDAQEKGYSFGSNYATAIAELRRGKKETHWIWYVLPQIRGLGKSGTTALFSIGDLEEARAYAEHPILGARLNECTEVLLSLPTDDPMAIFETVDALKFHSCMTLFAAAVPENRLFRAALDKFCLGKPDKKTLNILGIDEL